MRLRLALVLVGVAVFLVLVGAWVFGFLRTGPPTVAATSKTTAQGKQAYVTMQTVGSIGFGARPTWVSYLIQNSSGKWVHTTVFSVPAHATVHVTLQEFDGTGTLRNPIWATVTGTIGNRATVTGSIDNKKAVAVNYTVLPADAAAHTFSIPAMGLNVPLVGYAGNAALCGVAPCALSYPHDLVDFSFTTGGPGIFRWQCFMPCGLNFLDGNGGPMQTLGYMMGFMKVVG